MVNVIDETYFERGNLYIPNNKNLAVEPDGSPTIVSELQDSINKYERELLLNALGVVLYDELQVALEDLDAADPKWKKLVEGETYTNSDGNVKRWDGLQGYDKKSLIAFYVFTEYLRNDNETYATVGTVENTSKNATNVGATPKFIKAYNQFIEAYQGDFNANAPRVIVNGFGSVGIDWYGSQTSQVSLLRYLSDANELDETAFPNFEFRFYEHQNSFGI